MIDTKESKTQIIRMSNDSYQLLKIDIPESKEETALSVLVDDNEEDPNWKPINTATAPQPGQPAVLAESA